MMDTKMRSETLVQISDVIQSFAEKPPKIMGFFCKDDEQTNVEESETIKNIARDLHKKKLDMNYNILVEKVTRKRQHKAL
jgi:hypothetical protein